ncbi:hypothetical protein EJ05DRAFT_444058 [Pseudovirgaria hyperparasitica]|uniref:DH domain-containing protein n=1 Tax=Pseudovirgaria hyperparasitica TaxID=470096 RepID=A0A6A6VUX0_9PEZI|nr:uncharacterized protein EJ05DRAFT_444058 [Pseudovirgaria hyperparasitica]KAF2753965.1 hypothetical protein EJ05DRAFT_444058 [Pseudovirgaria hyperparasitica]
MQNQSHVSQTSFNSHSSIQSTSTTRSRDTAASATTLVSPASSSATLVNNGGPVEAANNVLNKRGDKELSLFQMCLTQRQRLATVPGIEEILLAEESSADDDTDPATLLWRTYRKGYPLMEIYNAMNPAVRLEIDPVKVPNPARRPHAATSKFVTACITELKFGLEDRFIIADLYGDDTTGFVKVVRVVNKVLDVLEQKGIILPPEAIGDDGNAPLTAKRTQREHIIDELVKTERTYVQHLELLQAFRTLVEERGVITGDAIHDIFLNLNALLDFQRRFLIRVEQTNAMPPADQNWGRLFVLYKDAFRVYEPYIANQKRCEEVAMKEYDKLREAGGPPELRQIAESPTNLTAFLLKPFQRLSKYPLLLRELRNKGDMDDARKAEITNGIEAAETVLQATNEAIDYEERKEAVEELKRLVEDWKGHKIEVFGELLLHGTHTVLKGDSINSKDGEREYRVYLFELILLCCKEIKPKQQKNIMNNRSTIDRKGKGKLQLKGRIFMQNVTETISIGKPGSYTCQIFWKGDPGIENFVVRFSTEEQMKKWAAQVDKQRRLWRDYARNSNPRAVPAAISATEFTYMRDHQMENPYQQNDDDDDDEDEEPESSFPQSEYSMSRNGSSTSLRSRSTTGESGPPMGSADPRLPPARFPNPIPTQQPSLTLRTQQLQNAAASAAAAAVAQDSYFSPVAETPASSRTSSSSAGMFPFPRQGTPGGGYYTEHNRYTAPAPGGMAREARSNMQNRPSLPVTQSQQARFRSASSPDIQNAARRPIEQAPPVPPFPTHEHYQRQLMINRSQSNSPNQPTSHPSNPARTQSPGMTTARAGPGMPFGRGPGMGPGTTGFSHGSTPPPPMPTPTPQPLDDAPISLKVKVHCPGGTSLTLVAFTNITFQSLKDRIDAKLQRSTKLSLTSGDVTLKFLDDGDYVSIHCDEDVQTAFETWREQHQQAQIMAGQSPEIDLFCQ